MYTYEDINKKNDNLYNINYKYYAQTYLQTLYRENVHIHNNNNNIYYNNDYNSFTRVRKC